MNYRITALVVLLLLLLSTIGVASALTVYDWSAPTSVTYGDTFDISVTYYGQGAVKIVDSTGSVVKIYPLSPGQTNFSVTVDTTDLLYPGMYLVQIVNETGVIATDINGVLCNQTLTVTVGVEGGSEVVVDIEDTEVVKGDYFYATVSVYPEDRDFTWCIIGPQVQICNNTSTVQELMTVTGNYKFRVEVNDSIGTTKDYEFSVVSPSITVNVPEEVVADTVLTITGTTNVAPTCDQKLDAEIPNFIDVYFKNESGGVLGKITAINIPSDGAWVAYYVVPADWVGKTVTVEAKVFVTTVINETAKTEFKVVKPSPHIELQGDARIVWDTYISGLDWALTYYDDYNGDGLPDIIAGSTDTTGTKITVISGKDGSILWTKKLANHSVDYWFDSAEDIDGDGINDLYVYIDDSYEQNKKYILALSGDNGKTLWSRENVVFGYSLDDIDRDGQIDAVVESYYDNLTSISLIDGSSGYEVWSKNYTGQIDLVFIPAGDLDGDEIPDIPVIVKKYSEDYLQLYDEFIEALNGVDGSIIWNVSGYSYLYPAGDLNGDGVDDVVISNYSVTKAVRGYDGSTLWSVFGELENVLDVNGDCVKDVLVLQDDQLVAIDGSSGDILWKIDMDVDWMVCTVVKDLNGDYKNDIIVAALREDQAVVFAISSDGNLMWSKSFNADYIPYVKFAGDLNGDGKGDVIIYAESTLAVKGDDGTVFWNIGEEHTIPVGDFNGDGREDIFTTGPTLKILATYHPSKTKITKNPLKMPSPQKPKILQTNSDESSYYAKAFTGDNANNVIWTLTSDSYIDFVWCIRDSFVQYWLQHEYLELDVDKFDIDFNKDGLKDVVIAMDDYLYMIAKNVTILRGTVIIPNKTVVMSNYNYTLPVMIANVENLTGIDLEISFNPEIIEIIDVRVNDSLSDSTIYSYIKNESFRFVLASTECITTDEPKGVANIVFKTLQPGFTWLNVTHAELSYSTFYPFLPGLIVNGSVMVTVKGDFNGNGRVDVGDVVYVAWIVVGKIKQDLRADFNENGAVDIGDLAKIAYYLIGKIDEL